MKKNILKATLVVAFALIAGMNVYNAQQSDVMSDLALANVEALASGESSTTNRYIIRKSKFPWFPERSVQFSGKRTKRSVQKKGCTQHL